jgi:hypothetical protein
LTLRRSLAAIAVTAALALPSAASGQGAADIPNWPELLPPNPGNSADVVFPGFDICPGGETSCPEAVILEMYERWRPLSQDCDHRAVFALTYLRTTEEYFRTVSADPGFFADPPWVSHEDAVFAEFYFNAEDALGAGGKMPEAWRIAFEAADNPNLTGAGDLFLGMSAHINRDLPYTLGAVGLVPPGGGSRKPDHDRVNFFLNRIADPLQRELGERYDPFFTTTDAEPSPFDEIGILQLVRSWRQMAWQNAELLVNAADEGQRGLASDWIETYSTAAAHGIVAANTIPGYGEVRDEWCAQHNPDSARVRSDGRVEGRRLPVSVYADGPARFRVSVAQRRPGKGRRAGGPLAKAAEVEFSGEGWRDVTLRFTRAGRRAVARTGEADAVIVLEGPYGFRVTDRVALRR